MQSSGCTFIEACEKLFDLAQVSYDFTEKGVLTDRKGKKLPLLCHGKISGYREIFNPVPLYIGDKRRDINADYTELRFSVESKNEVKRVIDKFMSGEPLGTEFTRGLYYKASI